MQYFHRIIWITLFATLVFTAFGFGQTVTINSVTPATGTGCAPVIATVNYTLSSSSMVNCYVDGVQKYQTYTGGTSNWTTPDLSAGLHTLKILAQSSGLSASVTYVVNPQNTGTYSTNSVYYEGCLQHNSDGSSTYLPGTSYGSLTSQLEVGNDGYHKYRACIQWNIPDNIIPDKAIIDTVQINFIYSGGNTTFLLHNIAKDLSKFDTVNPTNNAQTDSLWSIMDSSSNQIGTFSDGSGNHTFGPASGVVTAVQNGLLQNMFVLGIEWSYEGLYTNEYYYSYPQIRIVYHYQTVQTIVNQVNVLNQSIDSVARWQYSLFTSYLAPQTFPFFIGTQEVLRAKQRTLSSQRYNNWNYSSDITNHHIFNIQATTNNLTAPSGRFRVLTSPPARRWRCAATPCFMSTGVRRGCASMSARSPRWRLATRAFRPHRSRRARAGPPPSRSITWLTSGRSSRSRRVRATRPGSGSW